MSKNAYRMSREHLKASRLDTATSERTHQADPQTALDGNGRGSGAGAIGAARRPARGQRGRGAARYGLTLL